MSLNLDQAVHYHYDAFPPERLDTGRFLEELLDATAAMARYDQMLKTMHNSEILLAPLRSQEAVLSSRIEGTISTMDEVLMYEAESDGSDRNTSETRSDVIETALYQRALRGAQQAMEDGYPLSQLLIRGVHQTLLSFGRGAAKSPGEFKKEQNYLADKMSRNILFVPISPERLPEGMDRLFAYIGESRHPALIKTALAHVEFEALHPFKDGNGRIGRMLITLMLWSSGIISAPHFYISGYFEENRDTYIDAMRRVSEKGDWEDWCRFFMKALAVQAGRNLDTADQIRSLYDEMKRVFAEVLSSKWSIEALDFVFTFPVFTVSRFKEKSGVPAASSARFTTLLLEKDLIRKVREASGRKPAVYAFEPLMRLVRV